MKYIIVVLLSALFASLMAQTAPALTKSAVHNDSIVKTTAYTAPTTKSVQPQPEKQKAPVKHGGVGTTSKQKLTTPPAKPRPQVVLTGCSSYRADFNQYNWNVNVAEAICEAESNGNPNAISPPNYDGLRDYGLMQLHGEPILNPASNIAAAYQKYQMQGWEAWTTYNTGRYLSYLE